MFSTVAKYPVYCNKNYSDQFGCCSSDLPFCVAGLSNNWVFYPPRILIFTYTFTNSSLLCHYNVFQSIPSICTSTEKTIPTITFISFKHGENFHLALHPPHICTCLPMKCRNFCINVQHPRFSEHSKELSYQLSYAFSRTMKDVNSFSSFPK